MSQRGFSLLEVLIAFSILALSLGVLMRIFSGALNNTTVAQEQTEALTLAHSLIAGAGIEMPLADGETTGRQGERLAWQLVMRRIDSIQNMERMIAPGVVSGPGVALWEINARVAWDGSPGTRAREVTLTTLRAGKEAPP